MSRKEEDLVRLSEVEADRLKRLYIEAELEILREVDRAMARGNELRYLRGMLDNTQAILEDLLDGSRQWCEQAIPRVYIKGTESADAMAGKAIAGFGAIHQQAVKVLADNTFDRLDGVRQVIGRRVEDVYRRYALEATRQSIIGYKSVQQVSREFRDNLRAEGITGFRDAAGRDWNMKTYADTVARTTTMQCHLEGTANRLLEHGHDLVVVSSHAGACEKCLPWQGRVFSLTGKTPGYPTLEEAKAAGLFHPNCRHAYSISIDLGAEVESLKQETGSGPKGAAATPGDSGSSIPVAGIADAAKQGIAQALSEALAYGLKTNTECLLTLNATTGQPVYNKLTGTVDRVDIPSELIERLRKAAAQSILSVHNHPSSSSFSDDDLRALAGFDSLKGLAVSGHDGTSYYIGRTPETGRLDIRAVVLDWHKYITKYYDHYFDLVKSGQMTKDQAWKEHTHRAVKDLAKAHALEYVRWSQK